MSRAWFQAWTSQWEVSFQHQRRIQCLPTKDRMRHIWYSTKWYIKIKPFVKIETAAVIYSKRKVSSKLFPLIEECRLRVLPQTVTRKCSSTICYVCSSEQKHSTVEFLLMSIKSCFATKICEKNCVWANMYLTNRTFTNRTLTFKIVFGYFLASIQLFPFVSNLPYIDSKFQRNFQVFFINIPQFFHCYMKTTGS